MFFDKVCSVSKLTADQGNANKESYTSLAGLESVPINIQPASAEHTAIADGVFGKTYVGFTTVSGISDGFRITVSGGGNFTVKGVESWDFPAIPHYRLTLFLAE